MNNKKNIKYCKKCLKPLTKNSLDEFCDDFCMTEYWSEIRKDQNYHLYNLKLS